MHIRTAKGKLLLFMLVIISFPLLQYYFNFFGSGQLTGDVRNAAAPTFSWDSWWDASYQAQRANHFNDSIGCRPDLVRLNNQLDKWLFGKFHAREVVEGKDECFFEQSYVNEYYGTDYIGEGNMRTAVLQLKKVQDTLEHMGKTFVFQYAPSKAYYYEDKLPDRPKGVTKGAPTNYQAFKRLADSTGIHQIDYNGWFYSRRNIPDNFLFTHQGIHWSRYGSVIAADSFIKYLESARNIRLPEIKIEKREVVTTPTAISDVDLTRGLNLIVPLHGERFCYPYYTYNHSGVSATPSVVYIGDSFLWIWSADNLFENIGPDYHMFYYFKEYWRHNTFAGQETAQEIDSMKWQKIVMTSDCITILYVPASFQSFDKKRSSIKKLYDYFYPVK